MKKSKINFSKIALVLFTGLMLLWNCNPTDDSILIESQTQKVSKTVNRISFRDLPTKYTKSLDRLKISDNVKRENDEDLIIYDESQILEIIDSLSNVRYSIKFWTQNQPENVLYNLILGANSQNEESNPFILKYTIDNLEEVYSNGYADFTKMKGDISTFTLDNFSVFIDNLNTTSARNENLDEDPCATYTSTDNNSDTNNDSSGSDTSNSGNNSGGGGSNNNTNDGNDYSTGNGNTHGDGSGGGEFENTDETNDCSIHVWSNGETGEVFGITWTCEDGSSGSTNYENRTENNDCPDDGDVPINDGKDFGPSCKSFNYINTTTNWQEASVININFNVYLIDNQGIEYLYSLSYPQPILFGGPSNLTNGGDISSGLAAEVSATALSSAMHKTVQEFHNKFINNDTEIDLFFREQLKTEFENFFPGGRVQFNSSTAIPPTEYQTYTLFRDNCL